MANSRFSDDQLRSLMMGGGFSSLLSGLFGDSGAPYEAAMDQYNKFLNQARETQNPFYQAGRRAITPYQNWLKGMQDPSGFINNLMGKYQESPYAHFQQQQGLRAAQNLGSAYGLTGSTPLQMQAQQNAQNISSQDMNQWLQNVLGINTQFGEGEKSLIGAGQGSANALTDLIGNYGKSMGDAAYGKEAGKQNDWSNIFGGFGSLLSGFRLS